ncbi:TetR/AcrR family transcriptional regulator [Agrobacterium rosae]|uniref:TetR/AcrR family transcriptional regulator n=1 Tax=Agrobacterium rosae TaxID=1972867 RepID=UPI003A8135DA
MARPLSEEKRQALLDAAAEFVANMGTGAPTSKIAKAAGVSEGTLFTYFPTKDDLLNELFLDIEASFIETMLAPYPADVSARDRLCIVWNRLIDWGLANEASRKALRQLKVSDRITADSRNRCHAMLRDARTMVEGCLSGHAAPDRINFYIDTILIDLADSTINAVAAKPEDSDAIRRAGFDLFWKGSAA